MKLICGSIFSTLRKLAYISKVTAYIIKDIEFENPNKSRKEGLMGTKILWALLILLIIVNPIYGVYCEPQPSKCNCQAEPELSRTEKTQYDELLYQLQKYWAELSLYNGTPNGLFDRNMETAVKNFQKKHHIKASGIIDHETWQTIGSVSNTAGVTSNLPPGKVEILIDLNTLTLSVLVNRRPFHSFPVAIGKIDTPSPAGAWKIINKGYWTGGKTKWLGLSVPFGVYGIHGTNQSWSIGHRASKGCIRMFNHHLEYVYQWVNPGTPVYIDGDPFRDRRLLKRGLTGSDVYFLQIRLKQLGYSTKQPNGVYDYWTETAMKKCQQNMNLPITGNVSYQEYYRLRLYQTD